MNYEMRKYVEVENDVVVVGLEDDLHFMFEDMTVELLLRNDDMGRLIDIACYDVMVSSKDGEIKNLAVVSKIVYPPHLASEVWTAVKLENPEDYRSDTDIHSAVVKLLSKTINKIC